jgi:translocator protein
MRGIVRQVSLGLSALIMVAVNGFIGGNVGATSDRYFTAVTAAGYTFAIWGPIFLGALVFAGYQALPAQRSDPRLNALGWPLTITYLATAAWPPIFQAEALGLSLAVIWVVLLGLVVSYLSVTRAPVVLGKPHNPAFNWLVRLPIAVFFGWVTVATILNTAVWLKGRGVTELGLSNDVWAAILLIVAASIGAFIVRRSQEVAYGLVLIWAAWGIVASHPGVGSTQTAAISLTVIILAVSVWSLMASRAQPERRKAV